LEPWQSLAMKKEVWKMPNTANDPRGRPKPVKSAAGWSVLEVREGGEEQ